MNLPTTVWVKQFLTFAPAKDSLQLYCPFIPIRAADYVKKSTLRGLVPGQSVQFAPAQRQIRGY